MTGKGKDAAAREDRLKAALKANIARRKAQARARADAAPPANETPGEGARKEDG